MIRHAKLFETAVHQLLVRVAHFPCPCDKENCPGLVLGVQVQTIGVFPQGQGLVEADCIVPFDLDSLALVIEALKAPHARTLLEIIQSTAYGVETDEQARKAIMQVLKQAVGAAR